jgi:pimeloyl-ACP methyl ester carboxylesterase
MNMASIVLVHGAWLDASAWREVIPALLQAGHTVHGVQLTLTSFEQDVRATRRVLARAGDEVTLVGHSYAGAVITAAAADQPRVTKLVYIAALAPEANEVFGSILGIDPPRAKFDLTPDADGMTWITADAMHDGLGQDVPFATIALLAAVQKPYAARLFLESLRAPAWRTRPSWYLVATEDRVLSPGTQRMLARRIGATVREVPTSHLPFLAQPQAVIDIIEEAVAG